MMVLTGATDNAAHLHLGTGCIDDHDQLIAYLCQDSVKRTSEMRKSLSSESLFTLEQRLVVSQVTNSDCLKSNPFPIVDRVGTEIS